MESLFNRLYLKQTPHRCFHVKLAKRLRKTYFPRTPFRCLLLCFRTFSILAMKFLILITKDSVWLQIIYFLTKISFRFLECLFPINVTLKSTTLECYSVFYLLLKSAIMETLRHCINQFRLFHNWIKLTKNFLRIHVVPGLYFKVTLGTSLLPLSPLPHPPLYFKKN